MQCKCTTFHFVKGVLVCEVCGNPSNRYPGNPKIEDKAVKKETVENKAKPVTKPARR